MTFQKELMENLKDFSYTISDSDFENLSLINRVEILDKLIYKPNGNGYLYCSLIDQYTLLKEIYNKQVCIKRGLK